MNKRTAAVLMLAASLALSSLALPAQAAEILQDSQSPSPPGIAAQNPTPSLSIRVPAAVAGDPNQVILVDQENLAAKQVTLQAAAGKEWTDIATKTFGAGSGTGSGVEFTRKYLQPGTQTYRTISADGDTVTVSNTLQITLETLTTPPEIHISDTGNTVGIRVSNGRGIELKVYRASGHRLLWSSPAPAAAAAFDQQIPIAVTKDGPMTVEVVAYRGGKEVSFLTHSFTARAPVKLGLTTAPNPNAQKKTFVITGDLEPGTQVSIQRANGSSWNAVWTGTIVAGQRNPAPVYKFPSEAIASFRAVQTKAGKTIASTAAVSVTYEVRETFLRTNVSGGLFYNSGGRVAAKNSVSQLYYLDRSLSDRTGYLQEYTGGRWVNLQRLTFKKAAGWGTGVKVSTPVTSATVTRKYRVYVPATANKRDWSSGTAVIEHMNPLHYTGYKRVAYNYMKGYCPNQTIVLINGWTSYANSRTHLIQLSTQLGTGKTLQYIALHECAHIRQFTVYQGDSSFAPRLNAIFGGTGRTGIERAADCMAYAMGADSMYGGSYTRSCSAYQMSAARKILSGGKP